MIIHRLCEVPICIRTFNYCQKKKENGLSQLKEISDKNLRCVKNADKLSLVKTYLFVIMNYKWIGTKANESLLSPSPKLTSLSIRLGRKTSFDS